MSNEYVQLRHAAAELESGTTSRIECPFCNGGSDRETSFAITRTSDAEALYKCHRASCGKAGRLAVWGFRLRQISDNSTTKGKSFTPRLYTRETRELGEGWTSELLDRYDIKCDESAWAGWREESYSKLLVCPVRSPLGVVRGYETRRSKVQVHNVSSPKTEPYRILDEPWLGWYRRIATGPVIVIEDPISSLKVSRHFQVACLHGSHINLDMLIEIISLIGNDEIILALDRDATSKALKFVVEWRFLAPNFRCVPLSKDLKYSNDSEIREILRA